MLALTLREPWASAVVFADKRIENRTWVTPFRGVFAVHAGKSVDVSAEAVAVGEALTQRVRSGCVVAVATLVDITRDSGSRWARPGFHHWVLDGVRPLAVPVPCVGRQMLFRLPLDVEDAVAGGLAPRSG